jgi:hypothetical protein
MGGKQVFEAQFSRSRITVLAALGLAYCAFGLFTMGLIGADLWPSPPSVILRAAGAFISAYCSLHILHYVSLLRKGMPAVRIDATGLLDRRVSDIVIPWERVEQLQIREFRHGYWPFTFWRQRFIQYRVDPAFERKLTGQMGWALRVLRWGSRGRFSLAHRVLDSGFDPLADALRAIPPEPKRLAER